MLHRFDHRSSTYEGATEKQLNVGILPQPSAEQKRDPAFVVQPHYWMREEVVESGIPKYPGPLATTLQAKHRPSIQYVLTPWAAGFHLHCGDKEQATKLLHAATCSNLDRAVARALGAGTDEYYAQRLAQHFPLMEDDVQAIAAQVNAPESLARDCGYDGPPFLWDEARRFKIRCELDAAFFHLYLPCNLDGSWRPGRREEGAASDETLGELAALTRHFPTARDAAAYILDQFPIVRQKDEQAHGCYRAKERILAIYDAMLDAQRRGQSYRTTLTPPPGQR